MSDYKARKKMYSLSKTFKNTWGLFKLRFKEFISLYLILLKRIVFLSLAMLILGAISLFFQDLARISILILTLVLSIAFLIYLILRIQVSFLLLFKEEKILAKDAYKKADRYMFDYFFISLFLALIISFGFLALIIPGLMMTIYWFIAADLVVYEDKKNFSGAIKSSYRLVKQYFWPLALRLYLLAILVSLLTNLFANISIFNLMASRNIIQALWLLLLLPFSLAYNFILYKNLKELSK